MNTIRFECTTIGNKKGQLQQDKDGYYIMPVGGLNVFNSKGEYYTYQDAKQLFETSSLFQRRVQKGLLRGEVGHPTVKPGMSEEDYVRRILTIEEANVCAYHREIWLDFKSVKDSTGKPVIAIMSKVAPSGPHGRMLKDMLDREGENVAFSIRSFTNDSRVRGVVHRALEAIVTFDYVNEPGIEIANKFSSPVVESADVLTDHVFTSKQIQRAVNKDTYANVATESAKLTAEELLLSLGWINKDNIPGYRGW